MASDPPASATNASPPSAKRPWLYAAAGSCLAILCLVGSVGGLFVFAGSPSLPMPGLSSGESPNQEPLSDSDSPLLGTSPQLVEGTAVAPDAAGGSGALLEDRYEDPGNTAVPLFGPESMEYEVDDGAGVGVMTAHHPGVLVAMYESPVVADFEATLELVPLDPTPGAGYGMVFRSDDAADGLAHYYLLLVSPADENAVLSRWGPGGFAELARVPFAPDAAGKITLLVRAQGGHIEVEVDGQPGIQVLDAAAEPGIFGLAMLSPKDGDQVAFWGFRVERLTP